MSFSENLKKIILHDAFNHIFRSNYFPVNYAIHAIYICLNIRLTTNNFGLSWYRSIILNYCFSISPLYLLHVFLQNGDTFFFAMKSFKEFFLIWSFFNIFPFDTIFILLNRQPVLLLIQVLDSFTVGRCLVIICKAAEKNFENQFLRIFIISVCCSCLPILIDLIDRFFIKARYDPMAYEIHYSKRLITASLFTVLSIITNKFCIAEFLVPLCFTLLSIFDIYVSQGEVFRTCDIIFPNFWGRILTFKPNPHNS